MLPVATRSLKAQRERCFCQQCRHGSEWKLLEWKYERKRVSRLRKDTEQKKWKKWSERKKRIENRVACCFLTVLLAQSFSLSLALLFVLSTLTLSLFLHSGPVSCLRLAPIWTPTDFCHLRRRSDLLMCLFCNFWPEWLRCSVLLQFSYVQLRIMICWL